MHHEVVSFCCVKLSVEMTCILTYTNWQLDFSTVCWEQIDWMEIMEIVYDFDLENVLNGWKNCFVVNFS